MSGKAEDPRSRMVEETMRYLDELSEMRIELGLDRVRRVAETMGLFDEESPPYVLVGGTNGKGSTAYTLYNLLLAHGLNAGLYTSPHLRRVTERVQVGGEEVSLEELTHAILKVRRAAEESETHLTYFEVLTLSAFEIFERRGVDVVVSEVGMGGRLDATNIAEPILSIITPISYDHQDYLGNTLEEIAREKAHILREDGEAVISTYLSPYILTDEKMRGEWTCSLKALLEAIRSTCPHTHIHLLVPALEEGSGIRRINLQLPPGGDGEVCGNGQGVVGRGGSVEGFSEDKMRWEGLGGKVINGNVREVTFRNEGGGKWSFTVGGERFPSPYLGGSLAASASTAVFSLGVLGERLGFEVNGRKIRGVFKDLRWEGRGDLRIWRGRRILLDGAHNLQAAMSLSHLLEEVGGEFHLIFGCLRDKPCPAMLRELSRRVQRITVVRAPTPRTTPPIKILAEFLRIASGEISVTALNDAGVREAVESSKGDLVITGSLYLVGEGLKLIER